MRVVFVNDLRKQAEHIVFAKRVGMMILMERSLSLQDKEQIIIRRCPGADMVVWFGDVVPQPDRPSCTALFICGRSK
ncbi:hypothetical protein D3C81_1946260 [compost metagenome]